MKKTQSMIMGSAMAALASSAMHRVFGAYAVQSAITQSMKAGRKLEARSRHMPHQGEREVGRRLRQAKRDYANRMARGVPGKIGFSRTRLTAYDVLGLEYNGKLFRGGAGQTA